MWMMVMLATMITYAGVVGDEHGDYDCAGNPDDREWQRGLLFLLVMVGRLVGPLVPAGWPVGPSWLAGWSLLVGRLVPFVGPVGPFLLDGRSHLFGPGRFRLDCRYVLLGWSWLVCTYVRTYVC